MTRHRSWAVILSVLCVAGCSRPGAAPVPAEAKTPAPLPAEVAALAATPAGGEAAAGASAGEGTLAATGEFVSPVRSELVSKLTGRVGRVFVDEGARVARGQPLLEIERDYFEIEVRRAEAEGQRAQAALDEARRDFGRKDGLVAKGSVAPSVHERSKAAFDQAQAMHGMAAASLALARQRLADATMTSPIDGVVMERRVDVGERLGDATVAFLLLQTAPLKLRFQVPERYLAAIQKGLLVRASVDPYPGETFEGRIAVVVQAIDPGTRTFAVEAEFPNRDGRLKPGLFSRLEVGLKDAAAEAPTGGGARAQAR